MIKNTKVRNAVPRWVKQPVKDAVFNYQLGNAIRRIRNARGEVPSRQLLSQLMLAWSNAGWVANLDYLEAVARFSADTHGPILECGTGATTILLAIMSEKRNIEVWSLEDSLEWKTRIAGVLARNGLTQVHVCTSRLVEYGEFVWYEPPLAQMPNEFSLVICDGPPGTTKGGRYGLLPVLSDRLPPGSTILLDDASRPGELELIKRWKHEAGFETELHGSPGHEYAVMKRRG